MAEAVGKSAASRSNYTPEERRLFGELFRQCDTEGTGVVTGEAAVRLFQRTRVSEQVLSDIWSMADTENRGFLLQEDFGKALRLIGYYQSQPGTSLRPEHALSPAPLPKFDGLNMAPPAAAPAFQSQELQAQHSGQIRIPPLNPDRIAEYVRLFDRAGAQNGLLSGDLARTSFEMSGLPSEILARIWNLADIEQRGSLNLTEFIIAMHLLASFKAKTLTALPEKIPPGLYEAAARRPTSNSMRSPTTRPGDFGAIPRQTSGPQAVRGQQGRQYTPPVASDWLIGPREKASYDELFAKVDTNKQGHISGEQAVIFFGDSGLPSEVLAQIWDLANIRRLDQLNRDEFAVAMYLIRNQRGKSQSDLPTELPTALIPPSLRGGVQPQATGLGFPTQIGQPNLPAPAPQRSHAEDLFGLDAITASPKAPVEVQTTGGSGVPNKPENLDPFGASPASPSSSQSFNPRGNPSAFFKPFAPQSSFGHSLAAQDTGASTGSAPATAPKQVSAMDDLLGDNDQQASKISDDTADLANMSNQIGHLRTQMQGVQNKKAASETELAGASTRKRDMELRLQQFRTQYEQEVKALKALEEQLANESKEASQLNQQFVQVQASYQEVQNRHREVSTNLDSTRRENASLKDRLRQINEYITQTKPEIDRLQSELRHQKGLTAIQKKQAEKLEEEKAQLERTRTEIQEQQRQESSRPTTAREGTTSSAASGSGSTNPFMRKSPQASVDKGMSPSNFSRTLSSDSSRFDNFFGNTFASPPATNAPPTSFHPFGPQGGSVRSSEPDQPTPSTSPPLSSHQDSPQVPIPPASRQITSKDLPFHDKNKDLESAATSVRVETPSSRYDFSTPTGAASPAQAPASRSTGAGLFESNKQTASPVASIKSESARNPLQPSFTGASGATDRSRESGKPEPSGFRSDAFGFKSQNQSPVVAKDDFDAAFASVGKAPAPTNGSANDPVAKFNTEFPPIKDEFPAPANNNKAKDEFPPITERDDLTESDSDGAGFDDDFTQATPKNKGREGDRSHQPAASQDFDSIFNSFPAPEAPEAPSAPHVSGNEFGGPLSSSQSAADKPFGSGPPGSSHGETLFGGGSGAPSAAAQTKTAAGPSTTGQDSSNNATSSGRSAAAAVAPQKSSAFDDFDIGFDDLADAKEADDRDHDDLLFGSSHADDEHEFTPSFDSPSASQSVSKSNTFDHRLGASGAGKQQQHTAFPADDGFGDFDFPQPAQGGKSAAGGAHDWDSMMKGINVDNKHASEQQQQQAGGSGTKPSGGAANAGAQHFDDDASDDAFPEAPEPPSNSSGGPPAAPSSLFPPEAPEPPKLGRAISQGTEHDDPILKRMTGMGYPRPVALAALERFDYDLQKATEYLASPQ